MTKHLDDAYLDVSEAHARFCRALGTLRGNGLTEHYHAVVSLIGETARTMNAMLRDIRAEADKNGAGSVKTQPVTADDVVTLHAEVCKLAAARSDNATIVEHLNNVVAQMNAEEITAGDAWDAICVVRDQIQADGGAE